MKKLSYLPLLMILYLLPHAAVADPIDNVAELIKQGNTKELAKLFASTIDITILKDENVYSKTQASIILEKFFNQNKPKAVKVVHKVNTNPTYRFGVLLLTTEKGTYRISFTLNEVKGVLQLIELRIETEKT
ncbi:hypothetical protein GCM10023149_46620 [Mucilaginibacter gynuensis]|uniref:DUF4783 domain-containing protein n=1 Tax=Mucilaginibacter gynuensis TaxID=1302236 RepID=A0ABP8HC20_9SPHI